MALFICIFESIFSTYAIMQLTNMTTTNPISLLLFFVFLYIAYIFQNSSLQTKLYRSDRIHGSILSALFTLFTVGSTYETLTLNISSNLFCAIILIGCSIGFFILYQHLVLFLYYKFIDVHVNDMLYPMVGLPYITFFLCLLCWLPMFLFEFPGVMGPDGVYELHQAVGIWQLNNHHSVLHVLLITFFYSIGLDITSAPVYAIAFYTVFQMVFMALVAGYTIRTLQIAGIKTHICVIAMLFYAIMPYQSAFACNILKDVIFSGSFTLFICTLLRIMMINPREDFRKYYIFNIFIPCVISGIFMCLLRHNGFIVFVMAVPFILVTFREKFKMILSLELIILVIATMIRFPFMSIYEIPQSETVESFSIPLQQISRVLVDHETLTETQYEELGLYLDYAQIPERYDKVVSDPIKNLLRETGNDYLSSHKLDFISLWISIGLQHPRAYYEGFVDQTRGFWYPDVSSDVGWADGIYTNQVGLTWTPMISGKFIIKAREIIFKLHTMIPLVGLLWSVGFAFWMLLLSISLCFRRQNPAMATLAVPALFLIMTLWISTPVAIDFRYAYPLIYGLPIYVLLPFIEPNL